VAIVADAQLGAEFSIGAWIWEDLSGTFRRGQGDQNAKNNQSTQGIPPSLGMAGEL
jgi:hypothetical protein